VIARGLKGVMVLYCTGQSGLTCYLSATVHDHLVQHQALQPCESMYYSAGCLQKNGQFIPK
jgi:hypothetical protein